jgi:putative nucleotidyltransferase with HDIG domain
MYDCLLPSTPCFNRGTKQCQLRWFFVSRYDKSGVMKNNLERLPSVPQCYRFMITMNMMDHIVAHSIQVSRVALLLVDALNESGASLDRDLVYVSALLHDITKTRSFETNESHTKTGAALLHEWGYHRVAHIVGQHVRLQKYVKTSPPREEEIVNYADKRVLHDQIVSLDERMRYIICQYGKEPENRQRILRLWEKTEELEKKFFQRIPFCPDDINNELSPDELSRQLAVYRDLSGTI